jgi:D-tagatose-1,6-bisphosphate aldolase subunit GatZ/KbaZ
MDRREGRVRVTAVAGDDHLKFFRDLVSSHKGGVPRGICSVCSAHRIVLEASFLQGLRDGVPVLVESTVNQVNQYGGYTGMDPAAFRGMAASLARAMGLPRESLILGGDHLGPYPWRQEQADAAMGKARELVRSSVRAGYAKIHLDASMPLGGDATDRGALDARLVARREAELASAAEEAFAELHEAHPDASPPVYVIGTEVPPPGGIVSSEETVPVTTGEDLRQTVSLCAEAFAALGLDSAWSRVCAVVAQPGVEYGEWQVHEYSRPRAAALCRAARGLGGIVLEGHSTDYQATASLSQLVQDGVAILKVGPALTFALRECLFGLEGIERELLTGKPGSEPSDLSGALERAMLANPSHWASYYSGDEDQKRLARRYSFSDRCRYYWSVPAVNAAVERLAGNLRQTGIPLTLLSQYLPLEYQAVRENGLALEPTALARESVAVVLRAYAAAARGQPA